MGRKHPFLSFMVIFPNLLSLISSQCLRDYDESSQPTNVTLTSSPPVMMDGRLHYCDSNQHCSITCINRNDNEHGFSPYFHVDNRCDALSDIRNKSGFSVLERGVVNTTITFPCSSMGAIRCVLGKKYFSAMIRLTKDNQCINRIPSSQTNSPELVPGPPLNASTPLTAPTSTASTPIGPTDSEVDILEPSVNIPLVVTLPIIIALLVGILVVLVSLIVIYKKRMKFHWRKICQRQLPTPARSEEEGNPEPDDHAIFSVSNASSHTTIPYNTAGEDVFGTSETTVSEYFNLESPNLDQDQVAVSISGQEQEVVSIGNHEQEVPANPVEEEQPRLGVGRRNEVPDGMDEDAELGLFKPVQATD